jgi:hypothetical protein
MLLCLGDALFAGATVFHKESVVDFAISLLFLLATLLVLQLVGSRLLSNKAWTIADALRYLRSLGIVFGGALLFIALNAALACS